MAGLSRDIELPYATTQKPGFFKKPGFSAGLLILRRFYGGCKAGGASDA